MKKNINKMGVFTGLNLIKDQWLSFYFAIFASFIIVCLDFVLTISHLTEIKQHCDHQILLKKDENSYSRVNYN